MIRRLLTILLTIAAPIAVVTLVFTLSPAGWDAGSDHALLITITGAYTFGVLAMLVYTRQWTLIGRGLVATMTGDALLYGRLADLPVLHHPAVLDVTRACFVVGVVYLVIGISLWIWDQETDDATLARDRAP